MKIRTNYDPPPIPNWKEFAWSAVDDNYEPGDCIGWGATEEEAKQDLMRLLAERDEDLQEQEELRWATETGAKP